MASQKTITGWAHAQAAQFCNNSTSLMSSRQIANYLAKQQAQGWPGSRSITGRALKKEKQTAVAGE